MQVRHPINGVNGETEPVRLVADGELERRVNVALLLVSTDVQVLASGPLVGETVDHPGVAVEVEDDGLVGREEGRPLLVAEAVGVVARVDELEQVDAVDAADLELGEVVQEEVDGDEGLVGADVAAGGHDEVGLLACVGAEFGPDADALGAVLDGGVHAEVLEMLLLIGDNYVDVIGRAENVIHHYEIISCEK